MFVQQIAEKPPTASSTRHHGQAGSWPRPSPRSPSPPPKPRSFCRHLATVRQTYHLLLAHALAKLRSLCELCVKAFGFSSVAILNFTIDTVKPSPTLSQFESQSRRRPVPRPPANLQKIAALGQKSGLSAAEATYPNHFRFSPEGIDIPTIRAPVRPPLRRAVGSRQAATSPSPAASSPSASRAAPGSRKPPAGRPAVCRSTSAKTTSATTASSSTNCSTSATTSASERLPSSCTRTNEHHHPRGEAHLPHQGDASAAGQVQRPRRHRSFVTAAAISISSPTLPATLKTPSTDVSPQTGPSPRRVLRVLRTPTLSLKEQSLILFRNQNYHDSTPLQPRRSPFKPRHRRTRLSSAREVFVKRAGNPPRHPQILRRRAATSKSKPPCSTPSPAEPAARPFTTTPQRRST